MKRECLLCGEEFEPKQKKQRFCCREHQIKYNNEKMCERIKKAKKIEERETNSILGVRL